MAAYEPGSGLSPDTKSSDALILDIQSLGTMRNNFCFVSFKPHELWYFVTATQTKVPFLASYGSLDIVQDHQLLMNPGSSKPFLLQGSWGHRDALDMAPVITSLSGGHSHTLLLPLLNRNHSLACPLNYLWGRAFYFSISNMFWTNTFVKHNKNVSAMSNCYKGF